MTEDRHVLHGFSSYARTMRDAVQPRNALFEKSLRDALGSNPMQLYIDVEEHSGQRTGQWPQGLVWTLARSSFFVWWQSPRWFASATCRWELQCFLARADRIADTIGAPRALVRSWLVEPVRINTVSPTRWAEFDAAALVFRDLYENEQVQLTLNCETTTIGEDQCRKGTAHFVRELDRVLADYGGLRRLAQVRAEDAAFQEEWLETGRRWGAWVRHETPATRDPLSTGERRRRDLARRFGRDIAILDGEPTLAIGARSERSDAYAAPPRGRDLAGRPLWDAEGADAVDDHVRSEGLRLPTREEGERMLAAMTRLKAEREAIGLREIVGDLWCRDPGGQPVTLTARRACAPIILVADETP